jgi:hypothetical protein
MSLPGIAHMSRPWRVDKPDQRSAQGEARAPRDKAAGPSRDPRPVAAGLVS